MMDYEALAPTNISAYDMALKPVGLFFSLNIIQVTSIDHYSTLEKKEIFAFAHQKSLKNDEVSRKIKGVTSWLRQIFFLFL